MTTARSTIATAAASGVLITFLAAAVWPDALAPLDPNATDYTSTLQPPSAAHPLGTDQLGRDLLSRLVHGTRSSLTTGVGATLLGVLLGCLVAAAAVAGPFWSDRVIMRFNDIGLAFPEILLALLTLAVLGPSASSVLVAIGIGSAPTYARLFRAQAQASMASGYVRSAFGFGVPKHRILLGHVLPNSLGPVLVLATIGAGTNIIIAAGLGFLGFGAQPPDAEWGVMLAEGRNFLQTAWWVALFPGLAVTVVVVSVTVIGRTVESTLAGRNL